MGEHFVFWEKWLVKHFNLTLVRRVSEATSFKYGESIMALHFCNVCESYRVGTHIDPLSLKERIVCVECQQVQAVNDILGWSLFRIQECVRIASFVHERAKREKKMQIPVLLLFCTYMFFGLGKEAPLDRGGKTISDLESEAIDNLIFSWPTYHEKFLHKEEE